MQLLLSLFLLLAQDAPTGSYATKSPGTYQCFGASATDGTYLYVFGGSDAAGQTAAFRRYHAGTDTWEDLPPMPAAVALNAGAYWNGFIYSFGNWDTFGTIYRYDIAGGAWETLATTCDNHSIAAQAVTIGNTIYLIGGWVAYANAYAGITAFDPAAETLTPLAAMPDAMGYFGAAVAGGKIYVMGGNANVLADEANQKSACYEYDPAGDTWATMSPLPTTRDSLVAFTLNGRVYASGGRNFTAGVETIYDETWELNPATNAWTQRASSGVPHFAHFAAAINGKGIVFASHPNAPTSTDVTEEFTPPVFGGDVTAPTVVITSPVAAAATPYAMTGTAADNVGVTQVTWSNAATGGTGTATGTTAWTATIPLAPGANAITVTAKDAANNSGTAGITVTYTIGGDLTPPTVTITTGTTATGTPMTVAGTAADNVAVTLVTWSNAATGATGVAIGTAGWTANIALNAGANAITVTAQDAAGNTGMTTITVTYTPGTNPGSPRGKRHKHLCGGSAGGTTNWLIGLVVIAALLALRKK